MGNHQIHIVIFGVSGSGKTLIGRMLADDLKIEFLEGDDYHSKTNIKKMRSGLPLNDRDRIPWLMILKGEIERRLETNKGFVLSCSALKTSYRNVLRDAGEICFVFLDVPERIVFGRVTGRKNHFMPVTLLHSQIETLELPTEKDHDILTIDATQVPEKIIADILSRIT